MFTNHLHLMIYLWSIVFSFSSLDLVFIDGSTVSTFFPRSYLSRGGFLYTMLT